ncbi:MAG: hypothetical protein QM734_17825 [Cyclobacteriaceae bacterium]
MRKEGCFGSVDLNLAEILAATILGRTKKFLTNGYSDGGDDDDHGKGTRSGFHHSINTSLYYRFSRRFGIEAGLMKTYVEFPLHDIRFQGSHQISGDADYNSEGNFDPTASYFTKYIAAHFYLKDVYALGIQTYFGAGIAFNNLISTSSGITSYFDQASNENLFLNGHFTQKFYSPFVETGFFFYSPHRKFRSFLSF